MDICKGMKRVARGWKPCRFSTKMKRVYGKSPCKNKAGTDGYCHAYRSQAGDK